MPQVVDRLDPRGDVERGLVDPGLTREPLDLQHVARPRGHADQVDIDGFGRHVTDETGHHAE
jgi:hypothetical protein